MKISGRACCGSSLSLRSLSRKPWAPRYFSRTVARVIPLLQARAWPPIDSSSCWFCASFSLSSLVLPVMLSPVFGVEQRVRKELQPAWELELSYQTSSYKNYLGPINLLIGMVTCRWFLCNYCNEIRKQSVYLPVESQNTLAFSVLLHRIQLQEESEPFQKIWYTHQKPTMKE